MFCLQLPGLRPSDQMSEPKTLFLDRSLENELKLCACFKHLFEHTKSMSVVAEMNRGEQ